jgi:uncharacterized membrane protein YfhO
MLAIPQRLEVFNRLQPMRSFHLLYVIFFILLGGLIGEYGIKTSVWRWIALLVPLAMVMVAALAVFSVFYVRLTVRTAAETATG